MPALVQDLLKNYETVMSECRFAAMVTVLLIFLEPISAPWYSNSLHYFCFPASPSLTLSHPPSFLPPLPSPLTYYHENQQSVVIPATPCFDSIYFHRRRKKIDDLGTSKNISIDLSTGGARLTPLIDYRLCPKCRQGLFLRWYKWCKLIAPEKKTKIFRKN